MTDQSRTPCGSSEPPPESERAFRVLLEAYLDGAIGPDGLSQMERMMADAPALRRVFVEVSVQEQSTRRLFAPPQAVPVPVADLDGIEADDTHAEAAVMASLIDDALRARRLQEVQEHAEKELAKSREKELRWSDRRAQALREKQAGRGLRVSGWLVWGSMAAVLLLGVWLGTLWFGGAGDKTPMALDDTEQPQPVENVAFLGDTVDADWDVAPGRSYYFRPGEVVTLSSGLAQVRFRSGATIVVQGPATFEATGTNGMRLVSGRLTAQVPESATGFRVETPTGLVTDHGTAFGVWINDAGRTLAQTFSGRITLAPSNGEGGWQMDAEVELLAGDAAESSGAADSVRVVASDALTFVQESEFEAIRDAEASAHARWLAYGYTIRRDPSVVAYFVFDDEDARQGRLTNHAQHAGETHGQLGNGEEIAAPRWVEGRFAQTRALRFGETDNGRTYGVVVPDSDALDLDGAMTFAFWVRAHDSSAWGGTLLSKREVPPRRMNYQLAVFNEEFGRGVQFGSGRDDIEQAGFHYSPWSERLTNPGWRHVAVTVDTQTIRYYIDGELVHAMGQNLPPLINDAALILGTNAVGGVSYFATAMPFQGDISELLIARRVFDDTEIRSLYENSRGDN